MKTIKPKTVLLALSLLVIGGVARDPRGYVEQHRDMPSTTSGQPSETGAVGGGEGTDGLGG